MRTLLFPLLCAALVLMGSVPVLAEHKPEFIERGKGATALVEVASAEGRATGSAFCIERSGLFITNAHVVDRAADGQGVVRLVIDIGRKTQRSRGANVLRVDDALDLALLKTDADSTLVPLELGRDEKLIETAPAITFGFPFGHAMTVRKGAYPDISVNPGRITALRRDKGRLEAVQFDGQLNPGNSGGPVVDGAGRVIGVAAATVRGAAVNFAIPVGPLSDFLTAPGLVFNPPPLAYRDRSRPVTWTIKVQPPTPEAKLPERVKVEVKIANGLDEPRTYRAQPVGGGCFKVNVKPVPRDPGRMVALDVRFANGQTTDARVKDADVRVGAKRFMLSDLIFLFGGESPRAHSRRGEVVFGPILGLGKVKKRVGNKTATIDLNDASQITVRPLEAPPPVQSIEALVEVKQGPNVLASVLKRADLGGAPQPRAVAVRIGRDIVIVSPRRPMPMVPVAQGPSDDGLVKTGGVLDVAGAPLGTGKAIRPPRVAIGEARICNAAATSGEVKPTPDCGAPLVRTLEGKIQDLTVGGGGRYLILTLKEARKLAVFDVNAADIVKTITLPSENVLVAAGAKAFVVAFPEQRLFQLWDLETLTRQGANLASPIHGRLKSLAMGSDSEGPLLTVWSPDSSNNIAPLARFSFLDPKTLEVLKAGSITNGGLQGIGSVSPSGGTVLLHPFFQEQVHVRASAGGDLYGIWQTRGSPSGFQTLAVHRASLKGIYNHDGFDHLAPGPDGHTVYTGRGGVLDAEGKPKRGSESRPQMTSELSVPSADPAYYLTIDGLDTTRRPNAPGGTASVAVAVSASVHAADDGNRLLTVRGLDEMISAARNESLMPDDFTVDKRFHLVPSANLLITIPFSNDRIVLRRLDITEAIGRLGGQYLIVTSPSVLYARSGNAINHQIEACSKTGGLRYTLSNGPDGLTVSANGQLTWQPPKRLVENVATAVITIADSSGQEHFHTITIRVN